MARPNRIPEKATERGMEPEQMVLEALQRHHTIIGAADAIGVSFQSLWDYVNPVDKTTGQRSPRFKKICTWIEAQEK